MFINQQFYIAKKPESMIENMHENLIGRKFGHLTVLCEADAEPTKDGHKIIKWKCRCDCGSIVITRGSSLKSGHTKGCGAKHRRIKDMTGKKFGKLTVISRASDYINKDGSRHIRWLCQCECGRESIVRGSTLRYGGTKSCGFCTRSDSNMGKGQHNLTGKKFGRWTVLYENGRLREPRGRIVPIWHCRCECGEERDIRAGSLVGGSSLSCGCYKYEYLSEKSKHGFGIFKAEHIVNDFLSKYSEHYEAQVIYSDLRGVNGYPLSYDFAVYLDDKPVLLIECQGVQHYKAVDYFGGIERFEIQQKNDAKKREYAKIHNISLLEIPYTCDTKESIIKLLMAQNNGLFSYECP